jgi:SAM-dependent methyltransferase
MNVIWHDLECGAYEEDMALWRSLASERGGAVLDVGAGTGRVALDLARRGHVVTALDHDAELLDALARRGHDLPLETVCADAREFSLDRRFSLCLVPMQTIQLLGGPDGRIAFMRCARLHLERDGLLAIAFAQDLDLYESHDGLPAPLPDIREIEGVVYSSQPTAVRADADHFVLERRRETVTAGGARSMELNVIELDRLTPEQLEREGEQAGLRPAGRTEISMTADYVGSVVVMFSA